MKLVEVIKTDQTSEDTYQTLIDVTKKMKKTPVTCKDTPGYVKKKTKEILNCYNLGRKLKYFSL
jgi:3-hydroxyacyl-CoA dehydrogenase